MPFSDDHADLTRALAAQRGHRDPYGGERDPHDLGDPPPDIVARTMNAWKTGESVDQINADWRRGTEARRPLNDAIRRQAHSGYTGSSEDVLAGEGTGAVRDDETGKFTDLNDAAREAGSQPFPAGGIVPTERAPRPEDPIRRAYFDLQHRRARGEVE